MERSCLVTTGGEELSCCLLVSTGREELCYSDWGCGVVLFRLEERSCLVQTGGEELSCLDWVRGVVLIFQTEGEDLSFVQTGGEDWPLFRLEERIGQTGNQEVLFRMVY